MSEKGSAEMSEKGSAMSETGREFERFAEIIARLRAEDGCPWDRAQTHETLKGSVVEEAAEVIGGINILQETGSSGNLQEELGDLLLQIVLQAQIAEEEGLFDIADVIRGISDKMIRRHPHVFGSEEFSSEDELIASWESIKKKEKEGREWEKAYLPGAFDESVRLLEQAKARKEEKSRKK